MIEKALKYIVGLKTPYLHEVKGELYSDKPMEKVVKVPYAQPFTLTTLSSLVEYIRAGVDDMRGNMFVHIESPTRITVFSQLDNDRERENVVCVRAKLPEITVNNYVERESFNIALQSKFEQTTDRDLLLKFVGTVENGTVQEYGDDGVTQKAVIKKGITGKEDTIVPNPVVLKPFRTFTEVEQPASSFVFRMKEGRMGGIECAIYEADGGAWEREAMDNVKAYLKEALADVNGYIIIS